LIKSIAIRFERSAETMRRAKGRGGAARPMAGLDRPPLATWGDCRAVGAALSISTCMHHSAQSRNTRSIEILSFALFGRLTMGWSSLDRALLRSNFAVSSKPEPFWIGHFSDVDAKFLRYGR
jgi:hypothetical protein